MHGGQTKTLTKETDNQNFSAYTSPVTVEVDGDNDAQDGTDFNITLSSSDDVLQVLEFRNMTVVGGAGTDTLDMSDDAATINAQRGEANYTGTTANVAEFSGFERYALSSDDDTFTGGVNADIVVSNGGDDSITGGAGNDTFIFVDTDELGEINTQAIAGGIGVDTLQIGVLRTNNGYEVDLLAENTVSFSTDIETLKVTGLSDRDSTVHSSTIKVDSIAGFVNFVGATATDKISLKTAATADLSTWSFSNIRQVEQDAGAATDHITVKQAQLDQVARWLGEDGTEAGFIIKAETGAAAQTFDLTKNYFKDWSDLTESSDIKTTVIADERTIAGFTAMSLTANDTLQVAGTVDLSGYDAGVDVHLKFEDAVTLAAADFAAASNFKQITGTGSDSELTINVAAGATNLTGLSIAGVKTLVTTGSTTNGITLSATSVYDAGLVLNNSATLTLDGSDRAATASYATFNDLSLVGTNLVVKINDAVALSQSLLDTAVELDGTAGTDRVWVDGALDFSHIATNDATNVQVQDTKADTDITGMSAAATYIYSKGGSDSFTGGSAADTVTASAATGSLVASLGTGANSVTLSGGQSLTASYGSNGDMVLNVQSTSTGAVDATFDTVALGSDATPTIVIDLNGKGSQSVTIGDTLLSAAATGVTVDIGAVGDVDLTIGRGFADIDIDATGSGDISITAADGGHTITTTAEQTGFITIVMGANLDAGLTATGDGVIDINDAAGGSSITVGSGGWDITGGTGRDSITGGAGNDTIEGGIGGDAIVLSAGGYDSVVLSAGGAAVSTVTGAGAISMATFTGYTTVTGFGIGLTAATGDNLDFLGGTDFSTFDTNGIDHDTADDDLYLYTGTVDSLLGAAALIDAVGDITSTALDTFYVAFNNTAGTQFGVYKVTTVDDIVAADLDSDVGATLELVGVVNGQLTAANLDEVFV